MVAGVSPASIVEGGKRFALKFSMIPRIRELLHAAPFNLSRFAPATVVNSSFLRQIMQPLLQLVARVLIFGDDDSQTDLAALHVASILTNGKIES